MKKFYLILALVLSLYAFSQIEKKETVYLLFDLNNKEKSILIEDGSGNNTRVNKYRKEYEGDVIIFYIGSEKFGFNKYKSKKDTCSINFLKHIEIVDINYLTKKHNWKRDFKHHVFEKIYLVEKISNKKIIKYEVGWIDDFFSIE